MINLTCPNCAANLDLPEDRDVAFCSYCGKKILIGERTKVSGQVTVTKPTEKGNFFELAKKYASAGDKDMYEHCLRQALTEDESLLPKINELKSNVSKTYKKLSDDVYKRLEDGQYSLIDSDISQALSSEPCIRIKLKALATETIKELRHRLKVRKEQLRYGVVAYLNDNQYRDRHWEYLLSFVIGGGALLLLLILFGLMSVVLGTDDTVTPVSFTVSAISIIFLLVYGFNKRKEFIKSSEAEVKVILRTIYQLKHYGDDTLEKDVEGSFLGTIHDIYGVFSCCMSVISIIVFIIIVIFGIAS